MGIVRDYAHHAQMDVKEHAKGVRAVVKMVVKEGAQRNVRALVLVAVARIVKGHVGMLVPTIALVDAKQAVFMIVVKTA